MSYKKIVEILQKEGYPISDSYINFIENYQGVWKKWYKGHDSSFHEYKATGGERKSFDRTRSKLNMGKTVAEDWANFLLNEKTFVNLDDEGAQKYLVGDENQQEDGVLGKNNFWLQGNKLIERTYAVGTTAIVLTVENGQIEADKLVKGDIKLKYIKSPERIIPTKWENDDILDCIFISTYIKSKKNYFNAQIHEKTENGYVIKNREFRYTDSRYEEVEFEGVKQFTTTSKMFVIISPNIENNYIEDLPMGVSVYASSIEAFKSGDLAYSNFDKDFLLGGKKVFISQDGVSMAMNKDGVLTPSSDDTAEQSLYVIVPGKLNEGKQLFEEFNPTIRVEENTKGIQTALNLISVKCKLGPNFYSFDSESKRVYQNTSSTKANTETLFKSVCKQRIMITRMMKELVSNVLLLALALGEGINTDSKVSIQFDDTYFTDDEAQRNRDILEVRDGLMSKWEYRSKWFGETEEEARKAIAEIEKGQVEKEPDIFNE